MTRAGGRGASTLEGKNPIFVSGREAVRPESACGLTFLAEIAVSW